MTQGHRFIPAIAGISTFLSLVSIAEAGKPGLTHLFPAGGRRGTTVEVRVGGLDLASKTPIEVIGRGVKEPATVSRSETRWIEGPLLPLPESQASEDYPKDYAGTFRIDADADLGPRAVRAWTSQGACPSLPFVVGDLPEVIEDESRESAARIAVAVPITINGRIYPREDVDSWMFPCRAGRVYSASVAAASLGVPLDARVEILDPTGKRIAESDDAIEADPRLSFRASMDGLYTARILDTGHAGGPSYVYRLTLVEGTTIDAIFPLGVRKGRATPLEISGAGLVPEERIPVVLNPSKPFPSLVETVLTRERDGSRLGTVRLEVDDLPEVVEGSGGLTVPSVGNGRILRSGEIDTWNLPLTKGQKVEVELRSARFGTPLLGVLRVVSPPGKEVARSDPNQAEPRLSFVAGETRTYHIEVSDRFASRGGPEFGYRLRVTLPPSPDYAITFATDALTVPRGGKAKLPLAVERTSTFDGPIALKLAGPLPKGVSVVVGNGKAGEALVIAKGQNSAELNISATKDAAIHSVALRVIGEAKAGDVTLERPARLKSALGLDVDSVRMAVELPTPFEVAAEHDFRWLPRGSKLRRWFRINRKGYEGPIEVRLADRQTRHLQGVTGPTIVVPAGVTRFDYWVDLPPWMEIGRTSRAMILATGFVRDADGRVHEVSDSPAAQQMQMVGVIEPGRIGIELDRSSIKAASGGVVELPVRIRRGKLTGGVAVEVAGVEGVSGSVVIAGDTDRAVLPIRFAASLDAKTCAPALIIRAMLDQPGDPYIAEARVELVP